MAREFYTTLPYFSDPDFYNRATYLLSANSDLGPNTYWFHCRSIANIIGTVRSAHVLLLDSTKKSDLLAAATIGMWPKSWRPKIAIHGEMWHPNSGLRGYLERLLVRLADRSVVRYIVMSSEELEIFPKNWGLSSNSKKVRFCPYFFSLREQELEHPVGQGGYVFAGGNSHRDYELIVDAARQRPGIRFVVATRLLDGRGDLPSNLEAEPVPHDIFVERLCKADAVVVPIVPNLRRAAGQQTYLNAMYFGKPTIVTDTLGVRDHITDRKTGLIVKHLSEDLVDALDWVFDSRNEAAVSEMRNNAQSLVKTTFRFDDHIRGLLAVIDEI